MLRLSHRFTPPWFHFFKKSTGRGSGCQRLRYIRRGKALPPGGWIPPPPSPFCRRIFIFPAIPRKIEKKKKKVGLSTLLRSLMWQGFARCRVIPPCDIRPGAAALLAQPGPAPPGAADQRSPRPLAQLTPSPLREIGRAQVCTTPRTFRAHESEAIPPACCAAQISGRKFAKRG